MYFSEFIEFKKNVHDKSRLLEDNTGETSKYHFRVFSGTQKKKKNYNIEIPRILA